MVGASITLAVITLVVSFILGVMGSFPLGDVSGSIGDESSEFDPANVEEAGKRLEMNYIALIEDIASFQKNPDLERADERKRAFREYAQGLIGDYEGLSENLQGQMDDLISQANEVVEESGDTEPAQ